MATGNYGRSVRYMVLGPLRVTRDGEILPLGGPQQRLVLALLISANGETVSTSNLIEGVWGEEEPVTAKKTLQGYIHHLRSQVGDVLQTEGNGYSLDTTGAVDALEFEQLREAGRTAAAADPSNAANLFRKALALWSGQPYADLDGHHSLAPEVARLSDLRIAVLGDRIDADLACGGHNGLIGELEGLTQEYPLQERFRGQHMLALHRAGRQVEALRSFERTRRFLGEEMGLEPSADLQRLEQRILAGDEELLLGDAGDPSGRSAVRGYELREVVETGPSRETYRAYQRSVGREVTVDVLGAEIADDPIFIANYLADTQRIAALEHPNIGFVHDTWREPGHAYLVSRWFGGGSLADRLGGESLRMATAMAVIDHIGAAVSYAQRQGVAHGDLTAANVMLDDEGNAHLTGFVVGSGHEPDLAADRLAFAALAHLLLVGRAPRSAGYELEHDLLGADLPPGVDSVFEVAFEAGAGYGRIEDFLRALRQVLGFDSVLSTSTAAEVELAIRNPYKGLRAFQESDADDFYGRAELIERLVDRLDDNRLVAVVGPSGSGKSSVVKAGLAARVRAREGGVLHLQAEMFPGAFPFEELEGALLRVGVNRDSVIGDLLADERGLLRVLKQILPSDDSELLLVIDQFEELFSMVSERKVAQLFLSSLATAVADPRSRLRVVMTMRADFFDRPLESPEFAALMEAGLVPVSIPDHGGLAAAVSQPALSVGLDFEDGLIDRIVRDLDDQPGGLPLLQYAMTELVEQRTSTLLTFAAYEGIGGVYGALGQRAEDLYQSLKPGAREALRQSFLRMVSIDEGAKDLRRRVTQAELLATEVDDQSLNEALQLFGGHRLLTFDLDPVTRARTVEVAHEALTREWGRLSEWIEDQRDDIVIRKRLDSARLEWEHAGEDPSYLPTGSRLGQFEEWSQSTTLALSTDERAFLQAGSEREAEASTQSAARRRRLIAGLAAVAVIMTVVATFAFVQKRSSDRVAFDSETARLGAAAAIVAEADPQLSLLMAAEAFHRTESPQTIGALQQTMIATAPFLAFADLQATQLEWEGDRVFLLNPTGIEVIDSISRRSTHNYPLEIAEEQNYGVQLPSEDGILVPFAASPDARWVGAALKGARFAVVDIEGDQISELALTSAVTAAAFAPDNSLLAVGDAAGSTRIFSLPDLSEVLEVPRIDDSESYADVPGAEYASGWVPDYERAAFGVSALTFDPDIDRLAIAQGPRVVVVSAETGRMLIDPEVTELAGRSVFPFSAQELWFEGGSLVAKGLGTLVYIDHELGGVQFKTSIHESQSADDPGPTVARRLGENSVIFVLSDGRVAVSETPVAPPSDAPTSELAREFRASFRLEEIQLKGQLEEALAIDPTSGMWVVALDDRLVFGSVDGAHLLAERARRFSGASRSIAPDQILPLARSPFLSLGPTGTVAMSGSATTVFSRPGAAGYETSDSSTRGVARFAESGGARASADPSVLSNSPSASVFESEASKSLLGLEDFKEIFSLSPDGTWLAYEACDTARAPEPGRSDLTSCPSAGARVVDIFSGALVAELPLLEKLKMLEWRPDGGLLLATDENDHIRAWETSEWSEADGPALVSRDSTAAFRYSHDGGLAARVDTNGEVDIIDTRSGEVRLSVAGDAGPARTLRRNEQPWFSGDSELLLTAHDGTVRLWDVATGEQIGRAFPNAVEVVAGGRSGEILQLVTAVEDDLFIWNLDTSTWFDIVCDAAGRNMTRAEWDQVGPTDTEYRATCPQYDIES